MWLKGSVKVFSADYNAIDTSGVLDIQRYLMKETWFKIMFRFFKRMFIVLLTSLGSASSHTKRVSLRNHKCEIRSTLINLHPNGFSQELHYHLFDIKLDRCIGSCNTLVMTNTLIDLSNKVCVPNETEDLNLIVFNMIVGVNESKTLTNTAWKLPVFEVILVGIFPY